MNLKEQKELLKWKCVRCGAVRGKRNPRKDGWETILVGGKLKPLCPGCSFEFREAVKVHNEHLLQWIAAGKE